jgi:hypothetical protein
MNDTFYVYAYLRANDSAAGNKFSPYYIGKGKGNRAFSRNRKGVNLPKDKSLIVFVEESLSEEEAFALEKYCIALYGRVDLGTGVLRNLTEGGCGGFGHINCGPNARKVIITDEQKEKLSRSNARFTYLITDPSGKQFTCWSLRWFAKEYNLDQSSLTKIALGKAKSYKGWKCEKIHALKK